MSTDIKITYINKSYHQRHPHVVVFSKPITSPFAAQPTAWQVIKNIGYNSWHKFTYTLDTKVQVNWESKGHQKSLFVDTARGKNYSFEETDNGFSLIESSDRQVANQFEITNNVSTIPAISLVAFKDGNPIQIKPQVVSYQKVVFGFSPQLYFGISSGYEVGDVISPEVINQGFTEITLQGLYSLNVTMIDKAEKGCTFEKSNEVLYLWS